MNAEIITVGTELLAGSATQNTNLSEIALVLEMAGVEVVFATTVGDDQVRITGAISAALNRTDVVVVTGGLGPTHDDLTRDALAEATGCPLELQPHLEDELREFFARRGRPMGALNLRQAYLPRGAHAIANPIGTAPGIQLESRGVTVFALPGVPAEMRTMLKENVSPWLVARSGSRVFVTRILKAVGVGESDLAQRASKIIDACASAGTPAITLLAAGGEVKIVLRAAGVTHDAAMEQIGPIEQQFREVLGNVIFGVDDQTLESVVSDILKDRDLSVAVAESFTGGALASRFVSVPGASLCLRAGFVTYALEAKVSELGISQELLDEHGAVCAQTAIAMARQARIRSGSDLGLSTTGEAGPHPEEQPVGTMYIGLAWENGETAVKHVVAGTRQSIRLWGVNAALNALRLWLGEEH